MRRALNEIKYGTCAATGRSVLSKKNTSNLAPLANEGYSGFANPVRLDLGHQRLVQVASSVSKVIERQNSAVFAAFSFLHARKENQRCGGTLVNPDWQQNFVYSCSVRFCF
jgi:hypothetical protein